MQDHERRLFVWVSRGAYGWVGILEGILNDGFIPGEKDVADLSKIVARINAVMQKLERRNEPTKPDDLL